MLASPSKTVTLKTHKDAWRSGILKTMLLRPIKSTIVICLFLAINAFVGVGVWLHRGEQSWGQDSSAILSQIPSEMKELNYFYLEDARPSLSLSAESMQSLGEDMAIFEGPRGTYSPDEKKAPIKYQANHAEFNKVTDTLKLLKNVEINFESSTYLAQELVYELKKDLMTGSGEININHWMKDSGQRVVVDSARMQAKPRLEWARLFGEVKGKASGKLRTQEPLYFESNSLELFGKESLVQLKENALIVRGGMRVSARNGDIFLDQMNKKLKYFVMNDDVKLTEKLIDDQGKPITREAFAERLEAFGQEKMVLSGAPRVVQGKDVIKGYMITMREKMEFIEVEDALSDVQIRQDENEKTNKNTKDR